MYVRKFAKTLLEKIPEAKIRFQDESLTSVEAEERLKARKKHYEKGEIDAEAATIILQDFLENLNNGSIKPLSLDGEKDAKKKSKKLAKILTIVGVLIVVALLVTGGVLWIKEMRARERAEEYARQEAEMKAATFDFTIRPGETIFDIKTNLLAVNRNGESEPEEPLPNYTAEEIDEALNAQYDLDFLASRPAGATLEGFLYPETHNFYGDSTVKEVLEVFLNEMGKVIEENDLKSKYEARGLSIYEGVTLASIVQKEASSPEQPTVAQVFLKRLGSGIPLGSDVTVTYALDVVDPNRETYKDNQSALRIDSCYNTRLHGGLPCGPISNPGLSALLAVANPTDTAYLYFLTGDDGVMYYSYTEAEHNQNIYQHCQVLCNVSL
jgi:uncharacterized YceG family protein